jgi:hypothetical protein
VRDAFRAKGHDAWSCDLLPTDGDPQWHHEGDITDILYGDWDMLIAHPPCTYMTNSGVTWLHRDPSRWAKLDDAAYFFKELWDAPIKRIAIENPIMHKYAKERIGGIQQTQTIQPWMFGHTEQKATCLWLKNLPPLRSTCKVPPRWVNGLPRWANQTDSGQNRLPPSADRWKIRSETYPGIARAMAEQWGVLEGFPADLFEGLA